MESVFGSKGGAHLTVQPAAENIIFDENRLRSELREILEFVNDSSLEDGGAQVKNFMSKVEEVVFFQIGSIKKTGILECLFKSEYVSFLQQIIAQYLQLLDLIMQKSGAGLSSDDKRAIEVIVSFYKAAEDFIRDHSVPKEISDILSCLKEAIKDKRVKVVEALAPRRGRGGEMIPYSGSQIDLLVVDGELLGSPCSGRGVFGVPAYVTKLAEGAFADGSPFNDINSIHFTAKTINIKVHKYAFKPRGGEEVKPRATVHLLDTELQRYIKDFFNISEREEITIEHLHNYMEKIRKIQSEEGYGLLSSSVDPYLYYADYLSENDVLSCPGKKSLLEYLVAPLELLGCDLHVQELGIFAHPVQLSHVDVALFIKKIYLHRYVREGTDEIDADQREDHSKMAEVFFRMSEKFSPDQIKRLASSQDAVSFVKCFVKCVDEQVPFCETEQAQAPR